MTASALVAACLSAAGVAYMTALTMFFWKAHTQRWDRRR